MRLLTLAALMLGNTALAGQALNFEELKASCTNPTRFHNQVAPKNIQVTCEDVQYKWVSGQAGSLELETSRFVTSSLSSDKYSVDTATEPRLTAPQVKACPTFVQIRENTSATRSLTCAEITAYQGTASDFCEGVINEVRASNPKAVSVSETGDVIDTCGPSKKEGRGQRGQRGQRG